MKFEMLTLNKDFRRLYGRGKSFVCPYFVTYCLPNKLDHVRLGITTTKKLGCAVDRNRARRLLTAAFTQNVPHLKFGMDIVLVARIRILSSKSPTVAEFMKRHFEDFQSMLVKRYD